MQLVKASWIIFAHSSSVWRGIALSMRGFSLHRVAREKPRQDDRRLVGLDGVSDD